MSHELQVGGTVTLLEPEKMDIYIKIALFGHTHPMRDHAALWHAHGFTGRSESSTVHIRVTCENIIGPGLVRVLNAKISIR